MKLFSHRPTAQKNNSLLAEIRQTKQEIDDAYTNFQNASDPDLIDCYIYQSNAAWMRYSFLLRQAKTD